MKKRIFKQGVALMLAAVLALPANVVPAEILDQKTGTEKPHIVLNQEAPIEKATDSNAKQEKTGGQIIYNIGSFNVHVVSEAGHRSHHHHRQGGWQLHHQYPGGKPILPV